MKPLIFLAACLAAAGCAQSSVTTATPSPALVQRVAAAGPNVCSEEAAAALAGAGVTAEQVEGVYYQPVLGGVDQDTVVGYMAWTRLRDRPGHLVVNMAADTMNAECTATGVYTRGGLEVAGVPGYGS